MRIQKELFDLIRRRFNTKSEMFKYLAQVFNQSPDTISKWSYGYTVINYNTLMQLVEHFKLEPRDLFNQNSKHIFINYMPIDMDEMGDYRNYMEKLNSLLSNAAKSSNVNIFFQADEIPIFHFMHYTDLTYFKLYAYAYDTNKINQTYEEFVEKLKGYDLEPVFKSIAYAYDEIPSTEIWDYGIVDNILSQIENIEALERFMNPESKYKLLQDLQNLIAQFKLMATSGEKPSGQRFDFFRKPSPLGNSFMILQSDNLKVLSFKVDTINSFTTFENKLVDDFHKIFRSSIDKSTALGIGAEKDRVHYFRKINNAIADLKNKFGTDIS